MLSNNVQIYCDNNHMKSYHEIITKANLSLRGWVTWRSQI